MKIVAALFILLIISLGLLNSFRKYKNGVLPLNFLATHCFIGLLVLVGTYFLLFK